jgi:hypothetical protein
VLGLLSAAHWLAGNRLESFMYLERLEDFAVRQGLDRPLAYGVPDRQQGSEPFRRTRLLASRQLTRARSGHGTRRCRRHGVRSIFGARKFMA